MQNQKKVKALIICCIIAIFALITISISLIVNINLAKKEIAKQQNQIAQLTQQINNLNNPPSDNDQSIIEGEN